MLSSRNFIRNFYIGSSDAARLAGSVPKSARTSVFFLRQQEKCFSPSSKRNKQDGAERRLP
jgi:hypothetical protein